MLEKFMSVDRIEVLENGIVQIRTKTAIMEDGVQITGILHRRTIAPGDNVECEDDRVRAICAVLHTPEVIGMYKAAQSAMGAVE